MILMILGASGYLGTKLIDYLKQNSSNIIYAISRNCQENVKKNVIWINWSTIENIELEELDCGINLSCCYQNDINTENDILDGNFMAPSVFLQFCCKKKVKKFISIDTGLPETFNIYSFSKKMLSNIY